MKRFLLILLSVMMLSVAGCNTTNDVANNETTSYEKEVETEDTTETVSTVTEKEDITLAESEEADPTETTAPSEEKESEETVASQEETEQPAQENREEPTQEPTEAPSQEQKPEPTEEPTTETTPEPEPEPEPEPQPENTFVGYDPNTVVSLAIAKCQAGGMITTQDNLANALAEGRITQEEYDEYYPYDGLESSYYSVFVETDLSKASTISGQPLTSEDAIATHIANMLLLENGKVFNIIYAGVYSSGGTDFYEFRCLR